MSYEESKRLLHLQLSSIDSGAGTGGAPQYLADQLTLCKLGEGRLSPPITTGIPNVFHLPASLQLIYQIQKSHCNWSHIGSFEVINTLMQQNHLCIYMLRKDKGMGWGSEKKNST